MVKKSLRLQHPIEYRTWQAMRARCNAPSFANVGSYQKKHIKVCDRWNSFENFYEDMGDRPEGCSIDRIDNNGDYSPENCRWTDTSTQAKNRGDFNIIVTHNGVTKCLKDWAKEYGIKYVTLIARMQRFPELSFAEILEYQDPRKEKLQWNGKFYTREELCKMYNIPKANFYDRYHKGWSLEKILNTPVTKKTSITNNNNN